MQSMLMRLLRRPADHEWSQLHLSHYVEGDLGWLARKRLELHAETCPDCSLGIRGMRALLRLLHGAPGPGDERATASAFDRVRADALRTRPESDRSPEL